MGSWTYRLATTGFFLTNPTLICGIMIAAFVLDAMPVNAIFRSALSNFIVDEHSELWSAAQFHIMDNRSSYEFRVIWTTTSTLVKCWSEKSFLSFKAFLELSLHKIMLDHMLQGKFKSSVSTTHTASSPGWDFVGSASHSGSSSYSFYRWLFTYEFRYYGMLFSRQTFKINLLPCPILKQHSLLWVAAIPSTDFIH